MSSKTLSRVFWAISGTEPDGARHVLFFGKVTVTELRVIDDILNPVMNLLEIFRIDGQRNSRPYDRTNPDKKPAFQRDDTL